MCSIYIVSKIKLCLISPTDLLSSYLKPGMYLVGAYEANIHRLTRNLVIICRTNNILERILVFIHYTGSAALRRNIITRKWDVYVRMLTY